MGAVPCGDEPAVGAGRGAGVLRRRGAWRGGARRGGEGRGPAVKARPLARDQPRHRSPGARPPCGEVRGAPVSAGSEGPSQRAPPGTGEGEQGLRFFRPEARERRGVCQSLGGLRGGREAAGGQEAALLPGEQRAGRGGGLRSPPPRLVPGGFAGRLSEALP